MYLSGEHVHKLRDAVEKRVRDFMIPSQMASLTQLFYARTLASFNFAERTCVATFSLDGEVIMLPVSPYAGENPRTTKKERKIKL